MGDRCGTWNYVVDVLGVLMVPGLYWGGNRRNLNLKVGGFRHVVLSVGLGFAIDRRGFNSSLPYI